MTTRMFLLFSHKLTAEQIQNAKENFGISEFVYLPENLQKIWSNIPPEGSLDMSPFLIYFQEMKLSSPDIVLVSGDFGATVFMVDRIQNQFNCRAVYATTAREVVEKTLPDGSIKKESVFKFVQFRKFTQTYLKMFQLDLFSVIP